MKNKKLEASMRELAEVNIADTVNQTVDLIVPALTASFALALHDHGLDTEQINKVLATMTQNFEIIFP